MDVMTTTGDLSFYCEQLKEQTEAAYTVLKSDLLEKLTRHRLHDDEGDVGQWQKEMQMIVDKIMEYRILVKAQEGLWKKENSRQQKVDEMFQAYAAKRAQKEA